MSEPLDPDILTYAISRLPDQSLHFVPLAGSRELANALSFKYPMEANIENMMRRAIMDYINQEDQTTPGQSSMNCQTSDDYSGLMQHAFLASTSILTCTQNNKDWHVITGRLFEQKRKKAPYGESKRNKVAEVRKRGACKGCRRRKVEVCLHCSKDFHLANFKKCNHPPAITNTFSGTRTGYVGNKPDIITIPPQKEGPSSQSKIPVSPTSENMQQDTCDFISPNSLHTQPEVSVIETTWSGDHNEMSDWTNLNLNSDGIWNPFSHDTLDSRMESVLF